MGLTFSSTLQQQQQQQKSHQEGVVANCNIASNYMEIPGERSAEAIQYNQSSGTSFPTLDNHHLSHRITPNAYFTPKNSLN